jgi:type 1 glutamine amidotransferase
MKYLVGLSILLASALSAAPMKALIVDGQNNHAWQTTTPLLKQALESSGLFQVDVATSPPAGGDMTRFQPKFSEYRVVVSNYNGDAWSKETQAAFEAYVNGGGGFVSYHAADNAFPEWRAYNEMIGLGGWGGRNEKNGVYVRFKAGQFTRDNTPGIGGHHGKQHPYKVIMRDQNHPIAKGLPQIWMHAQDELYDRLRGPAPDAMTILATAFSDPEMEGSGEQEPMLMALTYGRGRVFHTTLGHGPEAMRCVGFIVTLQRGVEWAATGKVTQKIPKDFPTAASASVR